MRFPLSSILFLSLSLAVAAAAPACSCGGDDSASGSTSGGTGGHAPYDAVTVEPAAVTLDVELGSTATQSYQAFADVDGQRTDISDACDWTVDPGFGSMAGAVLTAASHGGRRRWWRRARASWDRAI